MLQGLEGGHDASWDSGMETVTKRKTGTDTERERESHEAQGGRDIERARGCNKVLEKATKYKGIGVLIALGNVTRLWGTESRGIERSSRCHKALGNVTKRKRGTEYRHAMGYYKVLKKVKKRKSAEKGKGTERIRPQRKCTMSRRGRGQNRTPYT